MANPYTSAHTLLSSRSAMSAGSGNIQIYDVTSGHSVSTQYTGITIFTSSGTMSGRIRIYGLAESAVPLLVPEPAPTPLVLYDYGDENIPITGGWQICTGRGGGTHTKTATYLGSSFGAQNSTDGGWMTVNPINLVGYTRLYMLGQAMDAPEAFTGIGVSGVGGNESWIYWPKYGGGGSGFGNGLSTVEASVDISEYETSLWVGLVTGGANYGFTASNFRWYRVWLQ
jgi:hypothetical protein